MINQPDKTLPLWTPSISYNTTTLCYCPFFASSLLSYLRQLVCIDFLNISPR